MIIKSNSQRCEVASMTIVNDLEKVKKENEELKKQINDLRNQMAKQQKELREVVGDTDPQNSQFLND